MHRTPLHTSGRHPDQMPKPLLQAPPYMKKKQLDAFEKPTFLICHQGCALVHTCKQQSEHVPWKIPPIHQLKLQCQDSLRFSVFHLVQLSDQLLLKTLEPSSCVLMGCDYILLPSLSLYHLNKAVTCSVPRGSCCNRGWDSQGSALLQPLWDSSGPCHCFGLKLKSWALAPHWCALSHD